MNGHVPRMTTRAVSLLASTAAFLACAKAPPPAEPHHAAPPSVPSSQTTETQPTKSQGSPPANEPDAGVTSTVDSSSSAAPVSRPRRGAFFPFRITERVLFRERSATIDPAMAKLLDDIADLLKRKN